jgi:3'-5' exonuclease
VLYRILDIETVLDPAMGPPVKSNGDPCDFPPAPWWRVVAAASLVINLDEGEEVERADVLVGTDERRILETIARGQLMRDPIVVTFNGRHFDMPVIVARSMATGVDFRWYWRARGARYRFDQNGTIDLADELADYGAADRTGLHAWARLVGAPAKLGSGADVADMWNRGAVDELADYCMADVKVLAHVFGRWQRTRGVLSAVDERRLREKIDAAPAVVHRCDLAEPLEAAS